MALPLISDDGSVNVANVVDELNGVFTQNPDVWARRQAYDDDFYAQQDAGTLPHFGWQTNPTNPTIDYDRMTGTNDPYLQKLNQLLNDPSGQTGRKLPDIE